MGNVITPSGSLTLKDHGGGQFGSSSDFSAFITSVNGIWAEGETLEIVGGGYGDKGPTIIAADNFFGKVNGQSVALDDPQIGAYAQVPAEINSEYDSARGLGGNVGMKYMDASIGFNDGHAPNLGSPGTSDAIRIAAGISIESWQEWFPFRDFLFWSARYGHIDSFNCKDAWAMLGNRGDNPQDAGQGNDLVLNNDSGSANPTGINVFSNGTTFNPTYSLVNAGRWASDEWCFHMYLNRGAVDPLANTTFYIRGHVPSDRTGEDTVTDVVMFQDAVANYPIWEASTAYSQNTRILRTLGKGTEFGEGIYMTCKTTGTSGSSEPSWNITAVGDETTDNTVTWETDSIPTAWFDRIKLNSFAVDPVPTDTLRHFGAIYFAISDELSGAGTFATCRVEFFNNSDIDLATVFGILPPTAWSENSITVNCWTLGVAAADVHIRMVDKDDNKTALFKLVP